MQIVLLQPEKGIFMDSVTSTNTVIKGKEFPHGTWIVAEEQTAGRGRKDRTWEVFGEESLIFSGKIGLENFDAGPGLSLFIGTAVCKTILSIYPELTRDIKIKWPNDLYRGNKKVAGILIESEIEGSFMTLIIGVGLNLYGKNESIPAHLTDAGFLNTNPNRAGKKNEILEKLIPFLNESILLWKDPEGRKKELILLNELLLWKGQSVRYKDNGQLQTGILEGLSENGALILKTPSGTRLDFIDSPEDFHSLN
ncbi:biotin--[acetyl-CoA-carboxylase] ligase [Leptospira noguchii]|uniref:biotin--[biotin carboxyl-carrier protein] ligase n=4 Tax=Leptospira noguchii TaxID=28182 RepID=M6YGB9_9LEPT|nr:biotin--[acetyl-CoA-carboxylase] ligase [Leptospira noguchii]EMI71871.1 biotin-(acetyl-CoA-carboxylase) ligase [Leptospira noguchii str. Bonito]EMN00048.1 biotin-(acetyl-CoA-carboxylase) ligase [Leptospira noguchii str. 2007001578]EMO39973.1 biotin-(acetyl-CoA-carboxylase) ligase [Leptospira noguchii serovar Autumnalis str. ZUN142]EMO90876.1 biotin-(acetyl-CoA-carboxylase) ligase [Leptospira noguchii str. 2001034031]EMS86416.1 biotin-(acetyl-CoA-carboxylase) ligase [Leptospira noguchii str.